MEFETSRFRSPSTWQVGIESLIQSLITSRDSRQIPKLRLRISVSNCYYIMHLNWQINTKETPTDQ